MSQKQLIEQYHASGAVSVARGISPMQERTQKPGFKSQNNQVHPEHLETQRQMTPIEKDFESEPNRGKSPAQERPRSKSKYINVDTQSVQ